MKEPRADYHMAVAVNAAECAEIVEFRKQNPNIKMNGEMAKLVLAYIRGKIPLEYINRNVKFVKK